MHLPAFYMAATKVWIFLRGKFLFNKGSQVILAHSSEHKMTDTAKLQKITRLEDNRRTCEMTHSIRRKIDVIKDNTLTNGHI